VDAVDRRDPATPTGPPLRCAIDVCRLNGRDYVQGSQMVSRVCALFDPEGTSLAQAKFVQLTRHAVCAVGADELAADETTIGTIQLSGARCPVDIHLIELPGLAPARTQPARTRVTDLQHDHRLSGRYTFAAERGVDGVLDALVQGIKLLHEGLDPPVSDIWFTGLRGFALPLALPEFNGIGQVDVARLRILSNQGHHQSLMKARLTWQGQPQPLEGLVSFAFGSGVGRVD
jgi:hypothetical protein